MRRARRLPRLRASRTSSWKPPGGDWVGLVVEWLLHLHSNVMLEAVGQSLVTRTSSGNHLEQLRLLTFGGLNLLVGGQTTTGAATRRRRLALLALLAVSRD